MESNNTESKSSQIENLIMMFDEQHEYLKNNTAKYRSLLSKLSDVSLDSELKECSPETGTPKQPGHILTLRELGEKITDLNAINYEIILQLQKII